MADFFEVNVSGRVGVAELSNNLPHLISARQQPVVVKKDFSAEANAIGGEVVASNNSEDRCRKGDRCTSLQYKW